jgi:hypothetical protein
MKGAHGMNLRMDYSAGAELYWPTQKVWSHSGAELYWPTQNGVFG